MIRVSSMRSRIPNLRRGAACALSLAFLAGVPMAAPALAQTTYTLPAILPADSAGREGFLRIVNRSFQAGDVRIHAFDDTGERFGPITLALDAEEAVHLTSRDLERGSAAKGLPVGLGNGSGWWRLALETDLVLTPLAYVRTSDGFLTSMHDVVPVAEGACTAHPTGFGPTTVQLPASRSNRRARQSRRIRHQRIASIPDRTRFRGRPDPTPALIEKRLDRSVFLNNGRFEFMITSHPSIESHITQTWKCYFRHCPMMGGEHPPVGRHTIQGHSGQ